MSKETEQNLHICHKESGLTRIASGFDSTVYQYGDFVIKVYDKERNTRRLKDYMRVTNRASELTIEENYFLEVPPNKIKVPLRVNPLIKIYKCGDCGSTYGLAPFIPGRRLEVTGPKDFTNTEYLTALGKTSHYFEKRLGVKGIDIMLGNVKILKTGELVVTDLCGVIELLRKG